LLRALHYNVCLTGACQTKRTRWLNEEDDDNALFGWCPKRCDRRDRRTGHGWKKIVAISGYTIKNANIFNFFEGYIDVPRVHQRTGVPPTIRHALTVLEYLYGGILLCYLRSTVVRAQTSGYGRFCILLQHPGSGTCSCTTYECQVRLQEGEVISTAWKQIRPNYRSQILRNSAPDIWSIFPEKLHHPTWQVGISRRP
jgi:hypothetical protein